VRRLFIKIFLWFWISTSLVWSAFVFSTWWLESRPPLPPWHTDMERIVRVYGNLAVREYERGGTEALGTFLDDVGRSSGIESFIFDRNGTEIDPYAAPQRIREGALRVARDGRDRFIPEEGRMLGFSRLPASDGTEFVIAVAFPVQFRPDSGGKLFVRLLAAALVAGLGCYGLAYYLALPVARLRKASRSLASGDLAARVGERLHARRDEFGDLGRDFDEMAERLESFVASERRLLRDISHELRSPLARLGVALGLARQSCGPDATFALDRIELEAERLNEMIGRLLMIARLQGGAAAMQQERVDLEAMVREVVADAAFEVSDDERTVAFVSATPAFVTGDAALLKSAIENVIRNGIRHTAPGTTVEVSLGDGSAGARAVAIIAVRDHGPGVPAGSIADIFRPFYRVDDARDRTSGGAGLGLAIADGAVRLHGGTIEAANAPDGGLLVTIRLPINSSTNPHESSRMKPGF
jgi:signal transduction histidine kinase